MEMKESERVIIAKPVASKPSSSKFKSFSELLAGAINESPANNNTCSDTAVAAIRPKTVRFKAGANRPPMASSQAEPSGAAAVSSSFERVQERDSKPTLIYKPQAKLVSRTTVSLLASMGNFGTSHQQTLQAVEARAQQMNQERQQMNYQSRVNSSMQHRVEVEPERRTSEPSKNVDEEAKTIPANTDRPSYDGYNWRKYGQKQVKGSEYPRSYYKCTHPNCPVKKKVERSFDGQIAEIVYKGEHNHAKPQPPKRNSSGTQGAAAVTGQDGNERQEGVECRVENENEVALSAYSHLLYQANAALPYEPVATGRTDENSCGVSGECEEPSKEADDEEPKSKRRKRENQSTEVGISGEGVQEPHIVVQSTTDTEVVGDGFRWRKYGQKVVKGNPYPRSYYRCTGLKCNVRKHVERASDDPRSFITTYEGKHNHDMPTKNSAATPAAAESDKA